LRRVASGKYLIQNCKQATPSLLPQHRGDNEWQHPSYHNLWNSSRHRHCCYDSTGATTGGGIRAATASGTTAGIAIAAITASGATTGGGIRAATASGTTAGIAKQVTT